MFSLLKLFKKYYIINKLSWKTDWEKYSEENINESINSISLADCSRLYNSLMLKSFISLLIIEALVIRIFCDSKTAIKSLGCVLTIYKVLSECRKIFCGERYFHTRKDSYRDVVNFSSTPKSLRIFSQWKESKNCKLLDLFSNKKF